MWPRRHVVLPANGAVNLSLVDDDDNNNHSYHVNVANTDGIDDPKQPSLYTDVLAIHRRRAKAAKDAVRELQLSTANYLNDANDARWEAKRAHDAASTAVKTGDWAVDEANHEVDTAENFRLTSTNTTRAVKEAVKRAEKFGLVSHELHADVDRTNRRLSKLAARLPESISSGKSTMCDEGDGNSHFTITSNKPMTVHPRPPARFY